MLRLSKAIQVTTVGRHIATIEAITQVPEKRLEGVVQIVGTGDVYACTWSEHGIGNLGEGSFDIDMGTPIGYVLRWHLDNGA